MPGRRGREITNIKVDEKTGDAVLYLADGRSIFVPKENRSLFNHRTNDPIGPKDIGQFVSSDRLSGSYAYLVGGTRAIDPRGAVSEYPRGRCEWLERALRNVPEGID